MSTLYIKTAQYSIATATALMLFTAAPVFAAKKYGDEASRGWLQNMEASIGQSATANASTGPGAASSTPDSAAATSAPNQDPAPAPKNTPPAPEPVFVPAPAPASATTTADTATTTQPADAAPAPEPSPVASTLNAIEAAVASAKKSFFAKPVATKTATSSATTTGAIATTGIASLFQGSAMAGNVYASDKFDQSDTYKLLALSLALAAAGIFLTNTKAFSRTYKGLVHAIAVRDPQPRPIRFRA